MNNTFTLGYLPDFEPFSSESGGTVSGYGIELCLKIADRVKAELGLSDMQVRYEAVSVARSSAPSSRGRSTSSARRPRKPWRTAKR